MVIHTGSNSKNVNSYHCCSKQRDTFSTKTAEIISNTLDFFPQSIVKILEILFCALSSFPNIGDGALKVKQLYKCVPVYI